LSAPVSRAEVAPQGVKGNFAVLCRFSHASPDDPIVYPGKPGASHMHDFYGNTKTDAASTYKSMKKNTDTTCRLLQDTAGYWSPDALLGGKRLVPKKITIYYSGEHAGTVETIPQGLQLIGGSKIAVNSGENDHVRWFCGKAGTPIALHPYNCRHYPDAHDVTGVVAFPNCWDGKAVEWQDGAHMRYQKDGSCPRGFEHEIPRLSYRVHFGIQDPCLGARPCNPFEAPRKNVKLTLSSGGAWTLHADFWNSWDQEKLDQLVQNCINAHLACKRVESYRLTVKKSADSTGDGTVVSSDARISCGTACSAIYDPKTSLTLVATSGAGSTFVGWTGACSGTSPTCSVTMSRNQWVTARFDAVVP
jgi:uncharacterized repeat protein (TIGR02543 family)